MFSLFLNHPSHHRHTLLNFTFGTLLQLEPLGEVVVPDEATEAKATGRFKPCEKIASNDGAANEPGVLRSSELLLANHNETEAQSCEGKTNGPSKTLGIRRLPDGMRMEQDRSQDAKCADGGKGGKAENTRGEKFPSNDGPDDLDDHLVANEEHVH